MHNQRWVHGDIKPNNIVFDKSTTIDKERIIVNEEKLRIKIIDFGLTTRFYNDQNLLDQSYICDEKTHGNVHFMSIYQIKN